MTPRLRRPSEPPTPYPNTLRRVADMEEDGPVSFPPGSADTRGRCIALDAGPKSGVTRNVVVDETGTIVFLTRLFEAEEFEAMKSVIEGLVD